MNSNYILLLALVFFWFYFNGPYYIAWVSGILVLLMVTGKLVGGIFSFGKAGAKEFTRNMETDMQNASPKPPSGEYLTEIARETGRKTGEFIAPEDYVYKSKGLIGNLGQGAKNFFEGINSLFGGKYQPSHNEKPSHGHKPKKPVQEHHEEKTESHSHNHH